LFTTIYAGEGNKEKELQKLSFQKLFNEWNSSCRKEFIKKLKERIANDEVFKDLLEQSEKTEDENEKIAFAEDWYKNGDKLVNVSILLDIINILDSKINSRLPAEYFKKQKEDLEHIFPQTPIGDKIKDRNKQTQILLQYVNIINQSIIEGEKISIKEDDINWDDQEWKENIKSKIDDKIGKLIPINSIGNMCLLHESINRGYGNDFFLEKRIDIMRKSQQGYLIRPHVYDAFNKIYIERQDEAIDMLMMTKWDKSDILARRKHIINQISNFLK
jgi:hypothetical protein